MIVMSTIYQKQDRVQDKTAGESAANAVDQSPGRLESQRTVPSTKALEKRKASGTIESALGTKRARHAPDEFANLQEEQGYASQRRYEMRTRKVVGEPNAKEAPHGAQVSNMAASKGKKTASAKQQTSQRGAKRKAFVATEKKGQENLRRSNRLKKQNATVEPASVQVGRATPFGGQDEGVASGERVTAAVSWASKSKQKAKVGHIDDDALLVSAVVISKRKAANDNDLVDRHKRARSEESTGKYKDSTAVALEQPTAIRNYIRVGDFIDAGRDDPSEDPVARFRIDSYSSRVRDGYY
jgi:hypothetical protein